MGDASRLVRAMRKAAAPNENTIVDIVMGTVTSVSPLKIKTDKLELTSSFLILSALCKPASVKTSVGDHGLVTVDLWRGLEVGDAVYMLKCCNGQKYYVLQRKEGIQ